MRRDTTSTVHVFLIIPDRTTVFFSIWNLTDVKLQNLFRTSLVLTPSQPAYVANFEHPCCISHYTVPAACLQYLN